ncbi:hypothetical protein MKK63_08560 [Methylobacterium sp. J-088]|uniref:hypothetical protein n=1 Tax=Methylobacterium sp. J-088 TaxID=2836664 RepID=UPI001FBC1054|nr:hypothetical protein [Methylobacterium sp. J-088]MCJ2062758.1 hypothetical protein [Methylobacterium sp. J-088]
MVQSRDDAKTSWSGVINPWPNAMVNGLAVHPNCGRRTVPGDTRRRSRQADPYAFNAIQALKHQAFLNIFFLNSFVN